MSLKEVGMKSGRIIKPQKSSKSTRKQIKDDEAIEK